MSTEKEIKEKTLSLRASTFNTLIDDFDAILSRTIGNMEMKGAEDAVLTVKMSINLEKLTIGEIGSPREITKPTFSHVISSQMTVKEKKTGALAGDICLVWDDKTNSFVVRDIEDGQMTMDDIIYTDFEDADESNEKGKRERDKLPGINSYSLPYRGDENGKEEEYDYDAPNEDEDTDSYSFDDEDDE